MKPMAKHILRLSVGAFGLVLLVAGGWLWSSRRGPATVASISPPTGAASPSAAPPAEPPAASRFWPALLIREYPQITLQGKTREQALEEAYRRNHADRAAEWKVKMAFYGLVVDEAFRPVEGADVHFQWTDASAQGHAVAKAKSDAQGRFQLTGQHGKVLSVYVRKAGYYVTPASRARGFEFANPAEEIYYEPDPGQPVLFRLRKMGAKVNLVIKGAVIKPPDDGSGVYFDFVRGKQGEAGPMWVQTRRPPRVIATGHIDYPYDWRTILSIADGGFIERDATDEFGFEAPALGYTPTLDFNFHVTHEDFGKLDAVHKTYFFSFGSPPRYGRMQIEAHSSHESVRISYVLNPTPGERNLEYDEGALNYNSFEY